MKLVRESLKDKLKGPSKEEIKRKIDSYDEPLLQQKITDGNILINNIDVINIILDKIDHPGAKYIAIDKIIKHSIRRGWFNVFKYLIENYNFKDYELERNLIRSAHHDQLEVIKYLIEELNVNYIPHIDDMLAHTTSLKTINYLENLRKNLPRS